MVSDDERPSRDEIEGRVYGVLMDRGYVENSSVEVLDVYSLDGIEVILALEDEFGVFISDEDVGLNFGRDVGGLSNSLNVSIWNIVNYIASREDVL